MSVPPEIESKVYEMARMGLTVVAQDTRNTPAVVANAAASLEQWRADCERRVKEAKPAASP